MDNMFRFTVSGSDYTILVCNNVYRGEYLERRTMFTKQHYKAIADILRECVDKDQQYRIHPHVLADKLATYFEKDNPRFDKDKWINYLNK